MRMRDAWAGFAEAIDGHPFTTIEDLLAEVQAGDAEVWYGEHSAVFFRVRDGVIECGPATGDVEEILSVFRPGIERWGHENGITEIHIQAGRQGWSRALRPYGYEEAAVILRKKLSDGSLVQ